MLRRFNINEIHMKSGLILIFILSISFLSCKKDDCHNSINFINNSELDVYVLPSRYYPDTMYFRHGPSPINDVSNKVLAGTSNDSPLWYKSCWEGVISSKGISSDTLMVYVFDASVIENEDWAIVSNEYKVLKRYDLSLEDLILSNFTIIYP